MIDPLLEKALEAGGHLADDVAAALLEDEKRSSETDEWLAKLIDGYHRDNDPED